MAAGASKVTGKTEHTPDWQIFKTVKLGTITAVNDDTTVVVRSGPWIQRVLLNLRSVKLTPVAEGQGKEKKN